MRRANQRALGKCVRRWCPARSSKPVEGSGSRLLLGSIPLRSRHYSASTYVNREPQNGLEIRDRRALRFLSFTVIKVRFDAASG